MKCVNRAAAIAVLVKGAVGYCIIAVMRVWTQLPQVDCPKATDRRTCFQVQVA